MATEHVQIKLEPRSDSPPSIMSNGEGESVGSSSGSSRSQGSNTLSVTPPLWTHRVSASFNAMADQIAAASQAISMIPPMPDTMFATLNARLDNIERVQERLAGEFSAVKVQLSQMNTGPERFEKALEAQAAAFKLDQQRLPARLHNAMVTVPKVSIKPVIMANGKVPQNFPATRGEFEHLTKERYEALLKGYDLPITGDTAAKREAVRAFIGLPQ